MVQCVCGAYRNKRSPKTIISMVRFQHFFNPWFIGSLSGALATALYFGSDDWPRDLRQWTLVGVWGLYFFGVGNLVRALWRASRRTLGLAAGILLVVSVAALLPRPLGEAEIWAYRLTHPRALELWLSGQAQPLDPRALRNWVIGVLTPYGWMWGVTAIVGLFTTLVAGLRQRP